MLESDSFIVTKLYQLARSVPHLCEIGAKVEAKGVALKVLYQTIDTSTPTGSLMFNLLGVIALFEREFIESGCWLALPRPELKVSTRADLKVPEQRPTRCASFGTLSSGRQRLPSKSASL